MHPAEPDPAAARFAAEAFTRRRNNARAAVAAGGMSRTQCEEILRPWLAIACLAGADLPEFSDRLADRQCKSAAGRWLVSPGQARTLVAAEIIEGHGPRMTLSEANATVRNALGKARDKALNAVPQQCSLDDPLFLEAAGLVRLADLLGCKPYLPPIEQPDEQKDAA